MSRSWLIWVFTTLGKALRKTRIATLRGVSDAELVSNAYDLDYAIGAKWWLLRTRAPSWRHLQDHWRARVDRMDLTLPPPPEPAEIRLLTDNVEAFEVRAELYRQARDSIDLSTYSIHPDATGWRTVEQLVARARSGVRVRILVDDHICARSTLGDEEQLRLLSRLREAGIEVARYRDDARPFDINHRKLLIVDGTRAVIGGRNYGDHYSGEQWRDVELLVEGELARRCAERFEDALALIRDGIPLPTPAPYHRIVDGVGECAEHRGDLAEDNPILVWQLALIDAATQSLDIENSYIVLLDAIAERLEAAIARGVRVRIFTNSPQSNDLKSAAYALFSRFAQLVEMGCELYLRQGEGCVLHCKYMVADERLISLGSYNLNSYSVRFCAEANLQLDHPQLARRLVAFFEDGLTGTRRIRTVAEARALAPRDPISRMANLLFFDCQ